jgi:hypothetical protein
MNREPGDFAAAARQTARLKTLVQRLKAIKALLIGTHNSPLPIETIAVDLYYALMELEEGTPLEQVNFKRIDREEVMREYTDG